MSTGLSEREDSAVKSFTPADSCLVESFHSFEAWNSFFRVSVKTCHGVLSPCGGGGGASSFFFFPPSPSSAPFLLLAGLFTSFLLLTLSLLACRLLPRGALRGGLLWVPLRLWLSILYFVLSLFLRLLEV